MYYGLFFSIFTIVLPHAHNLNVYFINVVFIRNTVHSLFRLITKQTVNKY